MNYYKSPKRKAYLKVWRERHKERLSAKRKEKYRQTISLELLGIFNCKSKAWYRRNIRKIMWKQARKRAIKNNVPFNIEMADIVIPDVCPVLGTKFETKTSYAATLDRKVPELGYTKGNVWVVSMKANQMKSNATQDELRKFASWVLSR